MKNKLISSIAYRIRWELVPQNPVSTLAKIPAKDIIEQVIPIVYLYTRVKSGNRPVWFTEVISAIGHTLRSKAGLKRDSGLAAKMGAFVVYSFELLGLLKLRLSTGKGKHAAYILEIIDDAAIVKLWEAVNVSKTEKLPSLTPYAAWTSSRHPIGNTLVKTNNKEVLACLSPETHPMVFNCLNKAQQVGWRINAEIFNLVNWSLRNKTEAFAGIWEMQNPEARQSKLREAKTITSMAKRFLDETFYHLYYCDFRGRKYPATAYLHEQGSDLAKGLLLRKDSKAIGEQGYFWLLISIANNWAGDAGRDDGYKTDKLPLNDRVYWSLDNEEILISYASNPKVNQGWMKADKPWQFLAACLELKHLRDWQRSKDTMGENDEFAYQSSLECYIDGSNNGSQHLSALTKDEVTAPHVNLVPSDLPGDLYKYVAEHVWDRVSQQFDLLSPGEVTFYESLVDTLIDMKTQIARAPQKSERRAQLVLEIKAFKEKNKEKIAAAAIVYWNRVRDSKHRRKVVKRNVMTLPLT